MEKLQIKFDLTTGSRKPVAQTWYNDKCFTGMGDTFEEAEKDLIETMKTYVKDVQIVPKPKNIEIEL